jgi:hypothetical protein
VKNPQKPAKTRKRPVFGRHVFSDWKNFNPKNKEICKKSSAKIIWIILQFSLFLVQEHSYFSGL